MYLKVIVFHTIYQLIVSFAKIRMCTYVLNKVIVKLYFISKLNKANSLLYLTWFNDI